MENVELLQIKNLSKRFPLKGDHAVNAVNGVDLSIRQGETLGLVGESGCGKSTVGRMIIRLIEPNEGTIHFAGMHLFEAKKQENMRLRREVQIVFQDPYGSLNPRKKIKHIIEEPMRLNGIADKRLRRNKVMEILRLVELDESYLDKYPIELTQGEQQRIGVARAFVTNPKLVVLDEPTSLLDIRYRGEIVLLLKKLQKETNCAYLFISHDLNIVYQLSHTVAVMYLGRIVEFGSADQVFHHPQHPYTQALLSATLLPDPEQPRGEFYLKGEVPSPIDLPNNQCNFAARCPFVTDECRGSLPALLPIDGANAADGSHQAACFNLEAVNQQKVRQPQGRLQ